MFANWIGRRSGVEWLQYNISDSSQSPVLLMGPNDDKQKMNCPFTQFGLWAQELKIRRSNGICCRPHTAEWQQPHRPTRLDTYPVSPGVPGFQLLTISTYYLVVVVYIRSGIPCIHRESVQRFRCEWCSSIWCDMKTTATIKGIDSSCGHFWSILVAICLLLISLTTVCRQRQA
jgi:hypothetical protein